MKDTEKKSKNRQKSEPVQQSLQSEIEDCREETTEISETWAEDTIADLDDFIESQGIYIRQ